jgi:hypothetical protein
MAVDGITFTCSLPSFDAYRKTVPYLQFVTPMDANTGQPIPSESRVDKHFRYSYETITHTAEHEGLRLKAKEIRRTVIKEPLLNTSVYECSLTVTGSLHKHYHGCNYGQFHFDDVQAEIIALQRLLKIDPANALIENIEFGVNLHIGFPPQKLIANLLTYKSNSFNRYKDGRIGKYCPLKSDLEVKVYNKSYKERIPGDILRFECHYNRMRQVQALNISRLSDLQNRETLRTAIQVLIGVWANILIYPIQAEQNPMLPEEDRVYLMRRRAPDYWTELYNQLSRPAVKKQRDRLRSYDVEYGANMHSLIGTLIVSTWNELFTERLTNVAVVEELITSVEDELRLTIVHGETKTEVNECHIKIKETIVNHLARVCRSCGRDISRQRKGSVFCSERDFGKAAKKCRNNVSNPRNSRRRKINQTRSRGVLFDIEPYLL